MTKFIPQRKNANKHTLHGTRLLEKSITTDGFIDAQTAAADGEIISGSARLELSAEKFADVEPIIVESDGTRPVIVVRTDIPNADDPRARRLSIAANQIGATDWNPDGDLLKAWGNEDKDIKAMFADSEWTEITGEEKPTKDAEPQIDRAAELLEKWQVKSGDMFAIGEHRLICGDCTDAAVVARVMGGEKARFEFSDPPYEFETGGGGILKDAQHMKDIEKAGINKFDPLSIELISKTAVFCCNKNLVPVYIELAKKNKQAWDLCFYKKENTPPNFGGHLMTDTEYLPVIGEQSPNSGMEKDIYSKAYIGGLDDDHFVAWQKPLGLVEKFLRLFTTDGDIVIDRFICTGTTLVACQNLSRRGRAVEISPAYCAVTLERMSAAFPELEIKRLE